MNIWTLQEKHVAIRYVLLLLENEFKQDSFIIDTETLVGEHEIYLQHRHDAMVRAYLFTFGQQPNKYGVHLEFPQQNVSANMLEVYENLSYKSLADILSVHLDLLTDIVSSSR